MMSVGPLTNALGEIRIRAIQGTRLAVGFP